MFQSGKETAFYTIWSSSFIDLGLDCFQGLPGPPGSLGDRGPVGEPVSWSPSFPNNDFHILYLIFGNLGSTRQRFEIFSDEVHIL